MQALAPLLWEVGQPTACDPHAVGDDQCGEQRGPELKHSTTTEQVWTCFCGAKLFRNLQYLERSISHLAGIAGGVGTLLISAGTAKCDVYAESTSGSSGVKTCTSQDRCSPRSV